MRALLLLALLLAGPLAEAAFTPVDTIAAVVDDSVIMKSEVDNTVVEAVKRGEVKVFLHPGNSEDPAYHIELG